MTGLRAGTFPEAAVRERARTGTAAAFPDLADYGHALFGAPAADPAADELDAARLVPPVFVPERLEKLIDLAREPLPTDVDLTTDIGGFASALPVYLSAFGSTQVASADLGQAASGQAGALGVPMVVGENVVPVNGYGRLTGGAGRSLLGRIRAYADAAPDGLGGVVVQQSTEDADAEVWNLVYSDPSARPLLDSGRLGFELKVGQGAKPGLGGMTVVDAAEGGRLSEQFAVEPVFDPASGRVLRCASPGTFTEEILRQQVRLMRNNFPRARVWVKLPPGRDVAAAAAVAWEAGADAVTVDGAEGGSGWAPTAFLAGVGLPLAECLRRIGAPAGCLLVSGRVWEGLRAVKCLALGARATGLGRAALIAVDEDPRAGLVRLVECLALELRMLVSALGKYRVPALSPDDVWSPRGWAVPERAPLGAVR
ncbi:glutamate synthase-related protein [Saccharothrix syringae]|uniref:Glutamate synthase n=1 Tax=Saccharothrix syringae TaxID=103733 RepID=A0A5Q0H7C8_SACSY|nr:glutamate synthase-related protein [Saccharothrix syringae]QFZ21612.1 glutamate synthase [Saccharothrix syringae]